MLRQGKYEVRRLKRRQDNLLQDKLFTRNDKKKFWSEIRRLNHTQPRSIPCVDDISGSTSIANLSASKFNRNPNALKPPSIHRSSRLPLTHL